MALAEDKPIVVADSRFARFESIKWWDQARLKQAKVFVVGAGAIGNEVIKNLAMLGIGNLVIADMDRIEQSNLTRSVLFRESDSGKEKAVCAVRGAKQLYPDIRATPLVGNLLADAGLGVFRWADVVVGALDNREARVFVNSACARIGKIWIDGGIDVLNGIVRGFHAPQTACYECTMSQVDWDLVNKRRSCSLLARRALENRGTPTTPTTASIIAALEVAECIKHLHGLPALLGKGLMFDGLQHSSYPINYTINPDCSCHGEIVSVEVSSDIDSNTTLKTIWKRAGLRLNGLKTLEFARELVELMECPNCGRKISVLKPAEQIAEDQLKCSICGSECVPVFFHSITEDSNLLIRSPKEIGLPEWDILWARSADRYFGILLGGDNPMQTGDPALEPSN